jgi:hypothetical protein
MCGVCMWHAMEKCSSKLKSTCKPVLSVLWFASAKVDTKNEWETVSGRPALTIPQLPLIALDSP